jgi:hypothetical protein
LTPSSKPAHNDAFRPPAMAVLLETSAGDLVIDLLVGQAPKLCEK